MEDFSIFIYHNARYWYRKKTALPGTASAYHEPLRKSEFNSIAEARSLVGQRSIDLRGRDWNNCGKGAWTRRPLPTVTVDHPPPSFWSAQALSVHGVFAKFFHKFHGRDSPLCPNCDDEEETPEHVFVHCSRFVQGRPQTLDVGQRRTCAYIIRARKRNTNNVDDC